MSNAVLKTTLAALLAVIALGAVAWIVLFPTPRFPQPTGPYGIGTRIYAWTDSSRPEPFTADRADRRRLMVQVWYPAANREGTPEPYLDSREPLRVLAQRMHVPAFLLGNLQHAPTHAVRDAPAAAGRFPILLNPSGFMVFRDANLFWIEDLVSHGYVVVAADQPGMAAATVFSDGRVIPVIDKHALDRLMPLALSHAKDQAPQSNGVALPGGVIPFLADDMRFVLDQVESLARTDPVLAGHVDTGRVGAFGISLGGYIAPETCYRDTRLRACLAADAGKTMEVARNGLAQPVMILGRDASSMRDERARAGGWPEPEIAHTIGTQRDLFRHNRADAYYVTMTGMFHVNWTDAPLWSPLVRWIGLTGPIDPYRGFALTNAYTLAFFDHYLKGKPAPLLGQVPGSNPEARLEVRQVSHERANR